MIGAVVAHLQEDPAAPPLADEDELEDTEEDEGGAPTQNVG